MLKGYRARDQIFIVKLNKVEEPEGSTEPMWLQEFSDVFPEDLIELPPKREIDHDIEVFQGSEPISKTPYKMSLPEAIKLKE